MHSKSESSFLIPPIDIDYAQNYKRMFEFRKWLNFTICAISYLFSYFHRNTTAVLVDDIANDFNVAKADLGIFASLFFWPHGLLQPIVGSLADSFEAGNIIAASNIVIFIGAMAIALTKSLMVACIGRVLLGIGCSSMFVCSTKVCTNWFSEKNHALCTGVLMAIGNIGGVLSQEPLHELGEFMGWRNVMKLAAIISFVSGLLSAMFVRSHPFKLGMVGENTFIYKKGSPKQKAHVWENIWKMMKNENFWKLELFMLLCPSVYVNLSSLWGIPYLVDVLGFSEDLASRTAIFLSISVIIGSPILPAIAEHFHKRKLTMQFLVTLSTICCILMYFFGTRVGFVEVAICFSIIALGFGATQTIALSLFPDYAEPDMSATMTGGGNTGPFIGGALVQIITSKIIQKWPKNYKSNIDAYQNGLWGFNSLVAIVGTLSLIFVVDTKVDNCLGYC